MSTTHITPLVPEPNISRAKVLACMRRSDIDQKTLAERLGVSESIVSRGLRGQPFMRARIRELADILQVNVADLMITPKANDDVSSVQRLCGNPTSSGWALPPGCTIEMLKIGDDFHLYLVGPLTIEPQSGDHVVVVERTGRTLVGLLRFAADNHQQWVIMTGKKTPVTHVVARADVVHVRLVVSVLGWAWGAK